MPNNFNKLIVMYADGRTICNCGDAYYTNCGDASISDGKGCWKEVTDYPICQHGCSTAKLDAKEYIAGRVLADLGLT